MRPEPGQCDIRECQAVGNYRFQHGDDIIDVCGDHAEVIAKMPRVADIWTTGEGGNVGVTPRHARHLTVAEPGRGQAGGEGVSDGAES